ncbi:MAG: Uma2 family endonuclease [Gammaproteobacteria bacterium]|nr:Uma2 family endonuclease [Gammaproteobacteria bacterium]
MGLALRDEQYHSYKDYLSWPDEVRYELIDGVAYAMAPAPTQSHQLVVGELFRQIANALLGKSCQAFVAPLDVRLPRLGPSSKDAFKDENIDTVVQPDLVVVCDRNKRDRRGILGAPDWIIEVLSPSSAIHDLVSKRQLYERSGVREYWLVHPADRSLIVYQLIDGNYPPSDPQALGGQTPSQAVPEVVIDWEMLLQQLPDEY